MAACGEGLFLWVWRYTSGYGVIHLGMVLYIWALHYTSGYSGIMLVNTEQSKLGTFRGLRGAWLGMVWDEFVSIKRGVWCGTLRCLCFVVSFCTRARLNRTRYTLDTSSSNETSAWLRTRQPSDSGRVRSHLSYRHNWLMWHTGTAAGYVEHSRWVCGVQ